MKTRMNKFFKLKEARVKLTKKKNKTRGFEIQYQLFKCL